MCLRCGSGCALVLLGFGILGPLALKTKAQPVNFVPVTPCRVADTRNANGAFGGPAITGGTSRDFVIPNSACGIPSSAAAYSLNVAVVPRGTLGYLTVWPSGESQPLVTTLNSLDGRIKSNAAIVAAGANGAISVFATNTTDVILDINGYFVPAIETTALAFYPLTPCRIVDTRNPAGPLGGPALSAQSTRSFPISDSPCGLPANAAAYSLNFAAIPTGPLGYLTAWPTGGPQPVVAALNDVTGTIAANAVIVPAGTNGDVNVFATGTTDLVIDIDGYFAPTGPGGLSLYSLTPCRVLDTREGGTPPFTGTLRVNVAGTCGAPSDAQAYVFNATVVPPGPFGYLTLWPEGTPQPLTATLNAVDGAITSNMAIVPTVNGSIDAYASAPTQLIIDIFGYFAGNNPAILAPTNLQAVDTSSTTANLTWVNNDPAATAVRVEVQTGDGGPFQDIGAAASLTSTGIENLQPNTPYSFRVRAQQGTEYSPYSNTASVTTPSSSVQPLTITSSPSLPSGTVGVAYSFTLAASGGVPPYTWSMPSGQLAAGLLLNSTNGAVTGTPTQAGRFSFRIEVEDSSSPVQTATANLSMTISSSSSGNCATGQPCGATAPFCTSYTPPSTSGATAITSLPYIITIPGNYYLASSLTVSPGDLVGISIQASNVDLNLNGYTLTYGAGGSSASNAVGQYGIISCNSTALSSENLASVYGTNGYCSPTNHHNITLENGTITQSTQASGYNNFSTCPGASVGGYYSPNPCAPGGQGVDSYATTFSHNIALFFGYGDKIQHVTFNFQQVSSNGIIDDYEQAAGRETFRCNTFNNSVVYIDNRSVIEGVAIWGVDNSGASGDTIQYNTITGGPQGGILSTTSGTTINNNRISVGYGAGGKVEYSNGFGIYAWGLTGVKVENNYIANLWGRGIEDYWTTGQSGLTESGNYITTAGYPLNYEYNTEAGAHPGCEMNGESGPQFRGGGTSLSISNTFSSVSGGSCPTVSNGDETGGSFGLAMYEWGTTFTSSGGTYEGHALSGFEGGASEPMFGWEAAGLGLITSEGNGTFGAFTSTSDTFVGDSSVVYMDWGGLPNGSLMLISPTLSQGSNPVGFNTFRFRNGSPSEGGGNVCSGCFHIRDATFTNGASATDADMSTPINNGATAEYWIDWTYALTVTSGGNPVSGATVTIVDALRNTAFSGTTNASGQIVAVLTQFRMYNNSSAMVQENHTPDVVTISNTGCTTLNYNVTITGTTSDSRTLTCR